MTYKFNMHKPANFQVSIPLDHDVSVPEYLAVVKRDIPRWAQEYVDHVDTATTEEICKCTWDCHPDDLKIRPLHCRDCEHPRDKHDDSGCNDNDGNCICVHYSPRRVKLGDHNPACPVHSPVGRIMGFFEYIFTQQDNAQKIEVEDKEAVISEFRETTTDVVLNAITGSLAEGILNPDSFCSCENDEITTCAERDAEGKGTTFTNCRYEPKR